ncbi:hypothetical protein BV20DRAFT_191688 [Pilatotrama ljubarskyi]|nr:hypothetical protein BV20DRAFT_191688 [Pilatotrama ljubarskyi]
MQSFRRYWAGAPAPPPVPPRPPVGVLSDAATFSRGSTGSSLAPAEICTACHGEITVGQDDALQVPCMHVYHTECLLMLVEVSMRSTGQFPPRCCRSTIPTPLFHRHLTPEQRTAFALREAEQSTPRRVYCANPQCSTFLGPRDKRTPVRIYTCAFSACATRTCARCRAAVDPSADAQTHECKHDTGYRMALQLGSRLGWMRCPECEELIERHSGCPHMTCVCGTEFCYECGNRYNGCTCHLRIAEVDQGPLRVGAAHLYHPPTPPRGLARGLPDDRTPPRRRWTPQREALDWLTPTIAPVGEVPPEAHEVLYDIPQPDPDTLPWWDVEAPAKVEEPSYQELPWIPHLRPVAESDSESESLASRLSVLGAVLLDDPLWGWADTALVMRGETAQRNRARVS